MRQQSLRALSSLVRTAVARKMAFAMPSVSILSLSVCRTGMMGRGESFQEAWKKEAAVMEH